MRHFAPWKFRLNPIRIIFPVLLTGMLSAQTFALRPAETLRFPTQTDSNSPAHWAHGTFYVYNSEGTPYRSEGLGQSSFKDPRKVQFGLHQPSPLWIESTWVDDDGTVYAWYHHEPVGVCGKTELTAPKIGALVSRDGGVSFDDLGFVLESGDVVDCSSQNGYFAGGNGDFSVILDRERKYFYFLFGNYGGDLSGQGVGIARMEFDSRMRPAGSVSKYFNGGWTEAGLGGRVTPVFPARVSWSSENADAFWGPSIHWNTALNRYIMLLNHSCCSPGWPQEGVYISFNPDIGNPLAWSPPQKILDGVGWYPQVLGTDDGDTDKIAGSSARLYVTGVSQWEILFSPDPPPGITPDQDGDPVAP